MAKILSRTRNVGSPQASFSTASGSAMQIARSRSSRSNLPPAPSLKGGGDSCELACPALQASVSYRSASPFPKRKGVGGLGSLRVPQVDDRAQGLAALHRVECLFGLLQADHLRDDLIEFQLS